MDRCGARTAQSTVKFQTAALCANLSSKTLIQCGKCLVKPFSGPNRACFGPWPSNPWMARNSNSSNRYAQQPATSRGPSNSLRFQILYSTHLWSPASSARSPASVGPGWVVGVAAGFQGSRRKAGGGCRGARRHRRARWTREGQAGFSGPIVRLV